MATDARFRAAGAKWRERDCIKLSTTPALARSSARGFRSWLTGHVPEISGDAPPAARRTDFVPG
jgi:hypothetical protein